MAQLWASVPEALNGEPLEKSAAAPALTVMVDEPQDRPLHDQLLGQGHLYTSASIAGFGKSVSDNQIIRFLKQYPTLSGTRVRGCREDSIDPAWAPGHPSALYRLCFPVPRPYLWVLPPHEHRWITRPLSTDYRGCHVVLPRYSKGAPAKDEQPLHPLLIWWAILFGLSMLCRYRPVVWSQLIDINHSPYASAIEHLLDVGLDAVPDLVERTIRQAAKLDPTGAGA